ncbi:MAG: hypothetical protein QOD29_6122 [Alphaproteobacteria bacterium]|jgi:hypothetical protein|nr:hypothetical protein [Alphaproteobacteria bacterium]
MLQWIGLAGSAPTASDIESPTDLDWSAFVLRLRYLAVLTILAWPRSVRTCEGFQLGFEGGAFAHKLIFDDFGAQPPENHPAKLAQSSIDARRRTFLDFRQHGCLRPR